MGLYIRTAGDGKREICGSACWGFKGKGSTMGFFDLSEGAPPSRAQVWVCGVLTASWGLRLGSDANMGPRARVVIKDFKVQGLGKLAGLVYSGSKRRDLPCRRCDQST